MSSSVVQLLESALFKGLLQRARESPRLRINHNFHRTMEENPHRFLNVMIRGTYITPNRQLDPAKTVSFLILSGRVAFFSFDDHGQVTTVTVLGEDVIGIDIQPGVWHTLVVLSEDAVCFEVKPGPYSVANDKDFARWAPREGEAEAQSYLTKLLEKIV